MKRTLLSFATLVALVALVCFTSCKKEEQVVATFTASMEGCSDIYNTKTVLDGTALKWVSGDEVKIYSDGTDAVFTATPQSNATTATFTTTDPTFEAGASFIAYYPANSVVSQNSVTIPATQESVDGSLRNFPMHAYSTSNALRFTNLCGVLKLQLQKSGVTVTSIALTTDQTINGTYQVNNYNSTETATLNTTSVTNGTNTTTMECNQSIDQLHDFYIYLPAGTYSGLKLVITASDGSVCIKGPASRDVVIERSMYSTLTLSGDDLTFEQPITTANPLTFEAKESGATVKFNSPSNIGATMAYSTDGGNSWTTYDNNTDITLENVGDKVSFRAANSISTLGTRNFRTCSRFTVNGDCYLYGNIMSLLFTDYENATELDYYYSNTFSYLFYNVTDIYNHPTKQLLLPATELTSYCYAHLFDGCTSLTTAPALPANTLQGYCYLYMFNGCTSLTTAPALPATWLAIHCYQYMFNNCTSLTTAPALPATRLASYCYSYMFYGCTSLTTAPALPATELASYCYSNMFGKTALTTAPALPATDLDTYCYDHMFFDCNNLTTAPALPATTLKTGCYQYMFNTCDNLTEAPDLPAQVLVANCYEGMFEYCNHLSRIKCYATTGIAQNHSTDNWVYKNPDYATPGIFYKPAGVTWPNRWDGVLTSFERNGETISYWTLADLTD